jgi:hypothetical protein
MRRDAHYLRAWRMRCNTAGHEATISRPRRAPHVGAACVGLCGIEQQRNGAQHGDRPIPSSVSQSKSESESVALAGSRL